MNNKVFCQHIKKFIFWETDFFSQRLDDYIYINSTQTEYKTKNTVDFTIFKGLIFIFDGEDFYVSLDKNFKLRESGQFSSYRKIDNDTILIQKIVDFQNFSIQVSLSNDGFSSFYSDNNLIVSRGGCFYKNNQLIYKKDNQNIDVLDVEKNSKISFPLSTLGTWLDGAIEKPYQIAEFCGIYENTLVCTLTNGAVLLLDIEKGEVKAFFKDGIAYNLQQIDDTPIFCGLYGYSFVKINVETCEVLENIDLRPLWLEKRRISDQHYIYIGVSVFHDELLYFLNRNTVGIFNPSTCKIIDFHEFDFDRNQGQQLKGGKENLQVKDGKIYCLDTLGNLYELER